MSAIITDQLRILNAKNFVSSLISTESSYYTFIGLPNATEYDENWDGNPPAPKDNFDHENDYWDSMIALKKIKPNDINLVIRRIPWESGITYDMYRHDISRTNLSLPSQSTSLYNSNFYIINSEYKVYICLNNGIDPENPEGRPSLDEPTFSDLEPRTAGNSGDGYIWKYLYTIPPSEIIKFDSINFIPVPKNWGEDPSSSAIKTNARTSGQLKMVTIVDRGSNIGPSDTVYTNIPIEGDGSGATATVAINNDSQVESVTISNGGEGYTYGTLNLENTAIDADSFPIFNVIIPPKGGHGFDIYRELGSFNILLYSRIENDNLNPDFVVGNQIARFGIVQNPEKYNSTDLLVDDKVSCLSAIKLSGNIEDAIFPQDSLIKQTVGVGLTAVGKVISYDQNTGVLKYWQDRQPYGFNYDESKNDSPIYGFNKINFTSFPSSGGNLTIQGESFSLEIDSEFGTPVSPGITTQINNKVYYLGQEFQYGISNPEVKKYSGNVIYVDNRPSITRSKNQKEDIKVVLQF